MIRVETETGSTYVFDNDLTTVTRETYTHGLRRDDDTLRLLLAPDISMGERMTLVLEPLAADADCTLRLTSPVTRIEGNS